MSNNSQLPRRQFLVAQVAVAALAFGLPLGSAQAQPARKRKKPAAKPSHKPFVLMGATLHRAGKSPLNKSIVRVENGKIVSIASGGAVPAGVQRIDVAGKQLTAGLVDPLTQIGVEEVSMEHDTLNASYASKDPIRAAFRPADGYNPASSLVRITRMEGVTSAAVVPRGGLVTGVSAWADLAGASAKEALGSRELALHVHIDHLWPNGAGVSAATAMLRLREVFDDAKTYRANKAGYDRRQVRALGASRLDLETLVSALDGRLPVVFHVDRASDILSVLRFAKQLKLKPILASAAEGWKVAKQLAAAKVPVIVYPLDHGPRSFSALGAREDNAALLHKAGVALALSTGESHNARKLRQVTGNAVRAGLPHAAALAAVTDGAARMFGLDDRYGSPKVGRLANLVVWSGDPFELSSHAERVFIRGKSVELSSRQTALLKRYR